MVSCKYELGLLLKRKDINCPKFKNLIIELQIYLFEVNIMLQTISSLKNENLTKFDALVGDRKCQVRTSMIIDLVQEKDSFFDQKLLDNEKCLKNLSCNIETLIKKVNTKDFSKIKQIVNDLKNISLTKYFFQHRLCFNPLEKLKIASLCFITTLPKKSLLILANNMLSSNKINQLVDIAKIELCKLSISYEQCLATEYGLEEEQKALVQIEEKSLCSMTSFFPSFKVILKKMKKKKQAILFKQNFFCTCGGIKHKIIKLFRFNENNLFEDKNFSNFSKEVVMVVEGYQFEGSLQTLKVILNVPSEEAFIPIEFQKNCYCVYIQQPVIFEDIEKSFLAVFAQHAQFTSDVEIDFEGLGLEGSDLQREYEYLKTLNGFSVYDMRNLHLDHIYPNTIAAEMKLAQESSMKMKQPVARVQKQAQGIQAA